MKFRRCDTLTVGVELEVQILNSRDFNLARDAADLLDVLAKIQHPGEIKPEITESMIELNSSVHEHYATLSQELQSMRDAVAQAAQRLNLRVAGGGSHPFHKWEERRVYPSERFKRLFEIYGYLAKQFTVFGQHIHVGCPDGDSALYLAHMLARCIPHFIALSASSPFQQGIDTGFQSSRLNTVSAFPLSGTLPFVQTWPEFVAYFEKMRGYHIVESMKDFYWDIRPKPDYGTIEIRVLDTPLTVERAALLAAYAQTLAHYFLNERPHKATPDLYLVYRYNHFQACRYGLDGMYIDAYTQQQIPLQRDLLQMFDRLEAHASQLQTEAALDVLRHESLAGRNDAAWLRDTYQALGSMNDVARRQSERWIERAGAPVNA